MANLICKSCFTFHTQKVGRYTIQIIKFYNYFIIVKLEFKILKIFNNLSFRFRNFVGLQM